MFPNLSKRFDHFQVAAPAHPVALAVLLLVRVPCRRGRRRCGSRVLMQLGIQLRHRGLRRAGNQFRRRRGDHVRPAGCREDLLLLGQLPLRRLLVLVRAVELEPTSMPPHVKTLADVLSQQAPQQA